MKVCVKILIADDDEEVSNIIARCLLKRYKNIKVETVANGQEAVCSIQKNIPNILISDICMPILNGLELAKFIREKNLDTKIILLSGYNKFEYAQEAIKYGISNYILKPCIEEELYEALDKILKELDINQKLKEEKEHLELNLKISQQILVEKLLEQLIDGRIFSQSERLSLEQIFPFRAKYYCVTNIFFDYEISLEKDLVQHLNNEKFTIFSLHKKEKIYTLIWASNLRDVQKNQCYIQCALEQILTYSMRVRSCKAYATIGNLVTSYEKIGESWRQAIILQLIKNSDKNKNIISYKQLNIPITHLDKHKIDEVKNSIVSAILMGNCQIAEQALEKLLKIYLPIALTQVQDFYLLIGDIVYTVLNELKKNEAIYAQIIGLFESFLENQKYSVNKETLKTMIQLCCELVCENTEESNAKKIVEAIKSYIKDNLNNETLDLKAVSKQVMFSTSYVKQVFRKETGEAFKNYVIRLRLEKAEDLLKNSHYNIGEIAELCGYQNQRYFSSSFKLRFGISPSKYRQQKHLKMDM
jgi:two-component system response regulator YesN